MTMGYQQPRKYPDTPGVFRVPGPGPDSNPSPNEATYAKQGKMNFKILPNSITPTQIQNPEIFIMATSLPNTAGIGMVQLLGVQLTESSVAAVANSDLCRPLWTRDQREVEAGNAIATCVKPIKLHQSAEKFENAFVIRLDTRCRESTGVSSNLLKLS